MVERVPIGGLQRIDAKRYPGAHSGVSAPHFVARGRDTTVKVEHEALPAPGVRVTHHDAAADELADQSIRSGRAWSEAKTISKEIALTPRSRM